MELSSELDYSNKTILIVDDQRPFQVMLKGILHSLGARNIDFALTGEVAYKKCKQTKYNMLFVDYNLGTGKSGRQLLEDIKIQGLLEPDSLFILVTGENTIPMVMGAVEMEPDDYLIKPFSQNALTLRIERIYKKKQLLLPVYTSLIEKDYENTIKECVKAIDTFPRYKQFCTKLLSEAYWHLKDYDKSEALLLEELDRKRTPWALISLSKTYLYSDQLEKSLPLANEALEHNSILVDAYDIKAQIKLAQGKKEAALVDIKRAVELSPFSIERQHLLSDIARENEDFHLAISACLHIFEISKRSVYYNSHHLMNYIRSLIDASECCESKKDSHKFQKEALHSLSQNKRDEHLFKEFDYDVFEALCNARLSCINGLFQSAKKEYSEAIAAYRKKYTKDPKDTLPDSIVLLLGIGEFEQAEALTEQLEEDQVDSYVSSMLEVAQQRCKSKVECFNEENRIGIEKYKEAQYQDAIVHFEKALTYAPTNTPSALNLIQACLHILQEQKQPEQLYVDKAKSTFKIFDGIELPEAHIERYENLKNEFNALIS